MKKLLFIFALIFALSVITGCQEADPNNTIVSDSTSTDNIETTNAPEKTEKYDDPIKDYDNEQFISINNSETERFLVKGKKYTYYGNDVLIVNVENQTSKDYTITLRVTYYDETGKTIGRGSKTFNGFATGWQNYFVFQPNKLFDSFKIAIDTTEYNGIAYSQYLIAETSVQFEKNQIFMWVDPHGTQINYDYVPHTGIHAIINITNTFNEQLYFGPDFVIFDNKGEIFYINTMRRSTSLSPYSSYENPGESTQRIVVYATDILWEDNDDFVWPEELTGEVAGIIGFKSCGLMPQ